MKRERDDSMSPLQLASKRGRRLEGLRKCDECRLRAVVTWRYGSTNRGEIHLCSVCRPVVYERSFGRGDALDVAMSGGQWEANRRKH
jgi:hypothetical protein